MSQLNRYTKIASKKQNIEHKCILQESCETLAEIYSVCQGRSLRRRLMTMMTHVEYQVTDSHFTIYGCFEH